MIQFEKNCKKRGVGAGHSIGKHRKHFGGCFNKVGMTYFHKLRYKFYCPIVNVDKLWSLLPQEAKDNALLIDGTPYDFFKVMGKGMLPQHQPIVEIAIVLCYFQRDRVGHRKDQGGARCARIGSEWSNADGFLIGGVDNVRADKDYSGANYGAVHN
ncbi:hypothetical protein ACFX14_003267 [Malus domestica]